MTTPYSIRFLRPNFFLMDQCLMQKLHRVLMPEKVFFELERLLLMELSKGLVMVVISKSTRITGCWEVVEVELFLLHLFSRPVLLSLLLLMMTPDGGINNLLTYIFFPLKFEK